MSDNPTLVERLRGEYTREDIASAASEIERLSAWCEQYVAWAAEIKIGVEALERELAERTRERDESDAVIAWLRDEIPHPDELQMARHCVWALRRHRAQKDKP